MYIFRYILVQKDDGAVVQAAVAAVFIQDIDEIIYKVFLPASFGAALPEFHTPPYNNKFNPPDWRPEQSLRYHSAWGLTTMHKLSALGIWGNYYFKVPIIVGVSVAVVLALRLDPRIQCLRL
jgi:hypothetical protein